VCRDGELRHLEPQAFDLLVYLLEHRDRVVSKEELLDRVWGTQFVSESALTTRIKEVRRAIGDDGRQQRLVRNVRGRGYRFVSPVAALVDEEATVVDGPVMADLEPIRGRVDDITSVTQLLSSSRLVTLVGFGGVGKTRLAIEIMTRFAPVVADGVFFVDLAALASPDAVVPALLRTVGVPLEGDRTSEALRAVAARDALVVVDNCEHLIDAVTTTVQQILGLAANVRVLATSRERLGVRGERVWPVTPLDPGAARQLFLDRAQAVAPGFEDEAADVLLLDRVVEAVDRLPLAIEMAAARAGLMRLQELVALVTARLDLIRSPLRRTTDRHRTLVGVIEWSEELLDEDERAAFGELSVFAGPALAADVEGVISGADPVDRVCRLVEKSLAIAEMSKGPTRYRMLETVRRHARTRVGDADTLCRRHATWFTEVAQAADVLLRTPAERQGHEDLEGRLDELRVAHQWARSHALTLAARLTAALQLHAHTRLWPEPSQWARELVRLTDDEATIAHAWAAAANAAAHEGNFAEGVALAERALASSEPRAVAVALEALADIAMYQGDLPRCRALGRQLRDLGEQIDDRHAIALGLVDETLALAYGGDPAGALGLLGQLDRSGFAPSDVAWLRYAEGEALAGEDPNRAVAAFEDAIERADGVGNLFLGGVARVSVTSVHAKSADPTGALHAFARLIEDWQRHGNLTHLVTSLRNLIELFVRIGALEPAGQILGAVQANRVKRTYGDEARRLAAVHWSLEQALGARRLERAIAQGEGQDLHWASTVALHTIAQVTSPSPPPLPATEVNDLSTGASDGVRTGRSR
jgi:predicted ATPase